MAPSRPRRSSESCGRFSSSAKRGKVNFICVQIGSPGGSASDSVRLANFLADLDPAQVRTVAYVPEEARSDAAIVAFACDHWIVRPNAVLGGGGAVRISASAADDLRTPIQQIARRKARNWSLVTAMLDPRLAVFRYTQAGTDQEKYLSVEEYAETYAAGEIEAGASGEEGQAEVVAGAWEKQDEISTPDKELQIDGRQAAVLGLARFVVDNLGQLQQLYQLPEAPPLIGPNWAFDFVDALASPQLAGLLLFIGGFALIAELSSPGIGIGGFLSAVCFVLYFWSNFLHGTAEVLEILIFLTGLGCVLVEIFVIPGFGIFGLGGGALVIAALVLASQTFIVPGNDYQFQQQSRALMTVTMAGVGVLTGLVVLRKYMHRLPVLGRVMLLPPEGAELHEQARREAIVDYNELIGQTGLARSQLTPSGKAVFGQRVVDVISEGELIERGAPVLVVEAIGNRVVVRRAGES